MKKVRLFCLLATLPLWLVSCQQDLAEIVEKLTGTEKESADKSMAEIWEDPDGPPQTLIKVDGASSTLTRDANGITATFNTEGLIPGNAYTLWFVIFGDAPGPPIMDAFADGIVVGKSGEANFSGHLSIGEIFDKPLTSEVHLALRTHGPVQPEMMPDQIETMDGGCQLPDIGYPSGPNLYADSDVVGYCANVQVSMHPVE